MFSNIFTAVSQNAATGWVARRVLEVGGWLGAVVPMIMALPPEHQAVIVAILTGQGGSLSIAAVIGFGVYIWSQIMSYRETVKPQVVTKDHKKLSIPELTEAEARALTGYTGPIEDRSRL